MPVKLRLVIHNFLNKREHLQSPETSLTYKLILDVDYDKVDPNEVRVQTVDIDVVNVCRIFTKHSNNTAPKTLFLFTSVGTR